MSDNNPVNPLGEAPDFDAAPVRGIVRPRGGRLLLSTERGETPLALESLHGRLLGVTASWDPGRPAEGVREHWRCVAKLRNPALGEVYLEADTLAPVPFVGLVGGLGGATLGAFVAFTAVLAPSRGPDDDAHPPTFLNVWAHDGLDYRPVRRDAFPADLREGHSALRVESARRRIAELPAYVAPSELGLRAPYSERSEDGSGASPVREAFGYVPARWPLPSSLAEPPTVRQPGVLRDKVSARALAPLGPDGRPSWDDTLRVRDAILAAFGLPVTRDGSRGGLQLAIDLLMHAPPESLERLRSVLEPQGVGR